MAQVNGLISLKAYPSVLSWGLVHSTFFLMFKFIKKAHLVNYTDDNTINASQQSSQQLVVQTLQIESRPAMKCWQIPTNFKQLFWHSQTLSLTSKLMTSH